MDMISTGEKRKTVSMQKDGQEQRLRDRKVIRIQLIAMGYLS